MTFHDKNTVGTAVLQRAFAYLRQEGEVRAGGADSKEAKHANAHGHGQRQVQEERQAGPQRLGQRQADNHQRQWRGQVEQRLRAGGAVLGR